MPEGGVDGNPRCFAFDYATETLSEVASMAAGRVFPSATALADGEILVTAGLGEGREINGVPERWDGWGWNRLPEARNDESRGPTFQFLVPDGRLFRAGPERLTDWLDLETGTWSDADAEDRNQIRYHGTAVMYDHGKILLAGGCPVGPEEGWYEQCRDTVLATAEAIDLLDPDPVWRAVSPMAFPRHSHHATLLPDGTVLVTGGTDQPFIFNDEAAAILEAELWDPATESFTTLAPMDEPRHFQSAAVLLPDGRVLVAGGAFGTSAEDARFSWTGQIFSPSYLERGARPVIAGAPAAVGYREDFEIETPDALKVARVTLVRLSASSQGWNGSQRMVRLTFSAGSGALRVDAPQDGNVAPPGFYLLFILNDQGVPSVGHTLQVRKALGQ